MKTKKIAGVVSVILVICCSFKFIDNIIAKIGIKEQWVQREIKDFFLYNDELNINNSIENVRYPHYLNNVYKFNNQNAPKGMYKSGEVPYWISQVKKYIGNNNKIETAKELCAYLKNYLESDLFVAEYQKIRLENKPKSEAQVEKEAVDYFTKMNA